MINIAMPKGRLGDKAYGLLTKIGYECKDYFADNRKLVFCDDSNQVNYFWVKPSDVAIYVEKGAADVGFVGKDILLEYSPDVYELLDLDMGKCKLAVAAKEDFTDDTSRPLRVATKFVNAARKHYLTRNRDIEIIKLNGSIELAPILNLSDVIVDLVETGVTLRENNLKVLEEIVDISTRLIANKSAYRFKNGEIVDLVNKIEGVLK